jgi:hypothetical protein
MRVASSLVVVVLLAGCKADLGQCDMTAATQVVYAVDGTPYYPGQALVQQSCAGNYCHVSTAVGGSRFGAPHGLDFDLNVLTAQSPAESVPALEHGISQVRDKAGDMYDAIQAGAMPPGKNGEREPQSWTVDNTPVALDLRTDNGKAIMRNWLACNAPVIAATTDSPLQAQVVTMGAVVPPKKIVVAPTFQSVYDSVLKGSCVSCHTAGGPFTAMTPLDFSSPAAAYASLAKDASTTAMCGGRGKLVVPGSCKTSLLYLKLQPAPVVCGQPMPLGGTPVAPASVQALCDWIDAGAKQQ